MKFVIVISFVLVLFQNVFSALQITDEENLKSLPKIYEIGRPDLCHKQTERFCHLTINLAPKNAENPSKFWKVIEKTKSSTDYFRHDILKYAVCVNIYDSRHSKKTNTNETVSSFYTNKFDHLGLVANLKKIDCDLEDAQLFRPKSYDWIVLFSGLVYVTLMIFATVCDFRKILENRFFLVFSVAKNFRKMLENCDGEKLKCVQGMRFFTTSSIILCHTYITLIVGYVGNTEYFEEVQFPNTWFRNTARYIFPVIVQTFFVISGWFLSYGTLKIMKNQQNNKSPWKFVFLTFLNRCLRLFPVLGFLTLLSTVTWLTGLIKGPVKKVLLDAEFKRCRKNWWMNFIFINNLGGGDTCCSHAWYLAADTQLYLLSLIILAAIWKFNLNFVKTFLKLIFAAILLQVSLIYNENISDVVFDASPGNMVPLLRDQTSPTFFLLYTSPISRMATYFIGLVFGYYHYQIDEKKINLKINKIQEFVWGISFFTLPLISVIISNYKFGKLATAMLAALVKPVYALGISLGIFGMILNLGGTIGLLKAICEWKPIVFLGNMSYSVYLMQITYVFSKVLVNSEVLQISDWALGKYFMMDVIVVYFLGFVTHLIIELPMAELQNLLVPKMKAKLTEKDS